jgi:hypothetical protein
MPVALRLLLALGIVLTAAGLIGLAATVGNPDASRGLVRYVFIPLYALGALAMIGAGAWWLFRYTKRRP